MITRQNQNSLQQSQDFKSYSFGIKEDGLSHIFNVLRNQLYSDKVLAVLREYSCNAVDAHTEVGKQDKPIHVTLPTKLSLKLKVRDYGRGLTEKEIGEIYAMYGESTKRGTNEQIGQLGLGSKSAFAYGDNFVINSFVGGEKVSYNAFIDPSQVGRISKLSQESSKEESGIEIVIPVKLDDVDEFYHKAVALFKYFKVCPKISGAAGRNLESDLDRKQSILESEDGSWSLQKGDAIAVMGNIGYELDTSALNLSWSYTRSDSEEARLYDLVNSGIVLTFNIGDLDIAASREALQYTDATKTAILNKLKSSIKEIPQLFSKKFKDCKTLWEAKNLYNKAFSYGGFGHHIRKIVEKQGVTFTDAQGKQRVVTDNQFDLGQWKNEEVTTWLYPARHKRNHSSAKRVKGDEANHIIVKDKTLVIFDDINGHNGRLNRIAPLLEDYEGKPKDIELYDYVYLLRFGSQKNKQDFIDKTGFDFAAEPLSDYRKIKLRDIYPSNQTTSSSGAKKPEKHQTKEFVFDRDCKENRWHHCRSDFFNSTGVDIENDSGVYLKITGFHIDESIHPACIREQVEELEAAGIQVPELFAFKAGRDEAKWDALDENDNWTEFREWVRQQLNEKLEDDNFKRQVLDRYYAINHYKDQSRRNECEMLHLDGRRNNDESEVAVKDYIVDEDSPFKLYFDHYDEMLGDKSKLDTLISLLNKSSIMSELKEKHTPTYDLSDELKQLLERYQMLKEIDWHRYDWSWKPERAERVFNYINMVDITYHSEKRSNSKKNSNKNSNIFEVAEA